MMTGQADVPANEGISVSKNRPRILLLVNKLGGGGAERDVAVLCEYADRARFAFEVWTLLGQGDLEPIVHKAGIPVHCMSRGRTYDPLFALRAAREIARADCSLIHVFLPAIAFYAALAKVVWRAKAPLMYTELSAHPRSRLKNVLRRWSLRHCDHFCANSLGSRAYLCRTGADPQTVHLVPNGHQVQRYRTLSAPRATVRDSLGIQPDEVMALYVGRLIPSKRVCDLVDAVVLLRQRHPRLRVLVVGDGPERGRLEAQTASLGLDRSIRFLGRRLDIPDLLQCADLFVFPSETEGLANSVIEAALTGLPIVACDIGGVREIVLDGAGAYLTPCRHPQALAAAIARVLENPQEARDRASRSQKSAENEYAIQRVTQRLYTVYDEVLHA